ncbi:transporter [Bacillus sp. FJAT-47783]|uniref:transporter n=1 Tax=Bacillus sp. FJAT-47783 TaxID=2922712 RepID=UPI001FAE3997|nr:transporter [Bacillus sp. FJAT-47783]
MYPYNRQFQIFPFPFGQGGLPFPPFGGGQTPPFGPPSSGDGLGQGQQGGPPPGPPPAFTPQEAQGPSLYAVDPGGIRGCLYRYTYIRLNNGRSFWFYPTFVGRTSVAGWRWRRRQNRWVYYGIDLQRIRSYSCYY